MCDLITADTALLSAPRTTAERCAAFILSRPHGEYTAADIQTIVDGYFRVCGSVGLDPLLAISQMSHETGGLTSAWAARPNRNPAGIGVDGTPGRGCRFARWDPDAIVAHVGRLLAYALPADTGTPQQQGLIRSALAIRALPQSYRGAAPTLRGLNGRWASPGTDYADRITAVANEIRGH